MKAPWSCLVLCSLIANRNVCLSSGYVTTMASIPFLPHLGVSSNGDVVNVDASQRQSFTLTSKSPFKSSILSHKSSFTVQFQKKDARTAIGLASFQPPQGTYTYLTPSSFTSSPPGELYVTMGGAGFLYPAEKRAKRGYANGDLVKVSIDFATNVVEFNVNGESVGSAPWMRGKTEAYPVISCAGGPIVMKINSS